MLEKNLHTTLAAYAWALARSKGDPLQAVEIAKHFLSHSHSRVELIARAAVEAHTLPDLPDYRQVAGSFVGTLAPLSAFDALLPAARRLPLRAAIIAVVAAMAGATTAQGGVKPITKLELSAGGIDPQKAVAITVVSEEVMRFAPSAGIDFLNGELRTGVAVATNRQFLADLADGIAPFGSTDDPLRDLAAGLTIVLTNSAGKPFWIISRAVGIALSTRQTADGAQVCPLMTPSGGVIAGVPVLVSDELPEDTNGPLSLIVDATGLALADETVSLRFSRQADLIMDSDPGNGEQEIVSLFGTNSAALLVERLFGSQRLRDSAVAAISGATYPVPS